jgi:membrane fusion protein (multidrug efflux system)
MKLLTQIIVVAVLATAGGGAWYYKDQPPPAGGGDSGKRSREQRPAVLVEVVEARHGDVTVTVEAVGTAQANEAVTITSKVTGIVSKIRFKEGQRVKARAVLVELDARELRAELDEMRAERENAERLHERSRKLLEKRNIARARVDELSAELAAAEARVRADEARLADYVIRAPFAGRLGLRRVSVGALISPGVEITTLDDTSRIKVDFRVPESALAYVAQGQAVAAKSAAYPGRVFEGRVTTVGSRVDPVTRSVEARAEFANENDELRPGMFLTSTLTTETRENAVLIPEEAVLSTAEGHFVFTVVDDKVAKREVVLGEYVSGEVEALSGIEAGTSVVVGGVQKVRHGSRVKPVPLERAGAPAVESKG